MTGVFAGFEEDPARRHLEDDLTFQMGLLQDHLAIEDMQRHSMATSVAAPAAALPLLDSGLDQESSEALVICAAIAAIGGLALMP